MAVAHVHRLPRIRRAPQTASGGCLRYRTDDLGIGLTYGPSQLRAGPAAGCRGTHRMAQPQVGLSGTQMEFGPVIAGDLRHVSEMPQRPVGLEVRKSALAAAMVPPSPAVPGTPVLTQVAPRSPLL